MRSTKTNSAKKVVEVAAAIPANDLGSTDESAERKASKEDLASLDTPTSLIDFDRPFPLSVGSNMKDMNWGTFKLSVDKIIDRWFQDFQRGPKDGQCILQGQGINGPRASKNMLANHIMLVDCDTGEDFETIKAKIEAKGLFAIVWSTHSHLKTTSDFTEDKFVRWIRKKGLADTPDELEDLVETARDYLRDEGKITPEIVDSIHHAYITLDQSGGGKKLFVEHAPMSRLRIMFVLKEPFDFMKGVQSERIQEWKDKYAGACEWLGLPWDKSCTDPARLMYVPRISPDADVDQHVMAMIEGDYLDFAQTPSAGKDAAEKEFSEAAGELGVAASDRPKTKFVTKGLRKFAAKYAHAFAPTMFFEEYGYPERRRDGAKVTYECPNDEAHTNAGSNEDMGFVVTDGENLTDGFWMYCSHDSCKTQFGDDRLLFLDKACQNVGITHAKDLIKFCPGHEYDNLDDEIAEEYVEEIDEHDLSLSALVGALNKDSTPKQIEIVLRTAVKMGLSAIERDRFISDISKQTKVKSKTIQDTLNEFQRQEEEADSDAEVENNHGLPRGFYIKKDMIWRRDSGDDNEAFPVCPLMVLVGLAHNENDAGYGKVFLFRTPEGGEKEMIVEDADLFHSVDEVCARFADAGFSPKIGLKAKRAFVELLAEWRSVKKIIHTSKPGFLRNGVFVPPVGEVIRPPKDDACAVGYRWKDRPSKWTDEAKGTFEGWRDAATRAMTAESPQLGAGVLLGAVGPLMYFAGYDTAGIYWAGPTSAGKSSSMECQVSLWSDTRVDRGLRVAALATPNAMESVLEACNHTTGAIDDLQNGAEDKPQAYAYLASNGSGKKRLRQDASAKDVRAWEHFSFTISSELSPSQLLESTRFKSGEVAGAYARCVPIDVSSAPQMPPETYKSIMEGIRGNFGHAGPKIVEAVYRRGWHLDGTEIKVHVEATLNELGDLQPAERRAATVFAFMLLAGEMMIVEGLLGEAADYEACVRWAWETAQTGSQFHKLKVHEDAAQRLLEWAVTSPYVFSTEQDGPPPRTALGWYDKKGTLYLRCDVLDKNQEIGSTAAAAIEGLKKQGRLSRSGDRWVHNRVPGLGVSGVNVRHYRIEGVFDPAAVRAEARQIAENAELGKKMVEDINDVRTRTGAEPLPPDDDDES